MKMLWQPNSRNLLPILFEKQVWTQLELVQARSDARVNYTCARVCMRGCNAECAARSPRVVQRSVSQPRVEPWNYTLRNTADCSYLGLLVFIYMPLSSTLSRFFFIRRNCSPAGRDNARPGGLFKGFPITRASVKYLRGVYFLLREKNYDVHNVLCSWSMVDLVVLGMKQMILRIIYIFVLD